MLSSFSTTVAKALSLVVLGFFIFVSTAVAAESENFLTTNLSLGDEGAEVTLLQTWLSEDPELYPEQVINGTFGPATERAVQRFQRSVGVISTHPSGDGRYGKVGPVTRASLNARFSNLKGGVTTIEGSYDSLMRFDGTGFVALEQKDYELNKPILSRLDVWVNPATPAERRVPIFENQEGYSAGLETSGRLYAKSQSTMAVTSLAPIKTEAWQHITVLFTQTDAVFVYNNAILEIIPLETTQKPSFFGNLFTKISEAFTTLFPDTSYTADAPSPEPEETPFPPGGILGSLASFVRGLVGGAPQPIVVVETDPLPAKPSTPKETDQQPVEPSASEATASVPLVTAPPPTAPGLTIHQVAIPPSTTTTTEVIESSTEAATTSDKKTFAEVRAAKIAATMVVATTTRKTFASTHTDQDDDSRGRTPKDSTPLITLIGSSQVSIISGTMYNDPGAYAQDLEDGDISGSIVVGGDTIDYDNLDTYTITYNVTDSSGLAAKQVTRKVTIMGVPELSQEDQEPRYSLAPAGQAVEYSVSNAAGADPKFISVDINPLHVYVGDTQTFTVEVTSESGVESVTTSTELDTVTHELTLEKTDPTTFTGSWIVYDTHVRDYRTEFTATSGSGSENSMTMAWSDPCYGVSQGAASSLSANCTVSTVYGLDGGNLSLNGFTLTINSGGTWAFNPGTTITTNGTITKGSGGTIKKGYLFYLPAAGDIPWDTNTFYFFTTTPQSGYQRAATYSQGVYEFTYLCFAPETPILMADGSEKALRDIQIGDMVMGEDKYGNRRKNFVQHVYNHGPEEHPNDPLGMIEINGELTATPEHPVYTTRGWLQTSDLVVGDVMTGVHGPVPITSLKRAATPSNVYNLTTYPTHTFFAGGVLVHNFKGHCTFC